MNINLIPSNNGLGHVKRMVLLSNYLAKNHSVKLIAQPNKINKFKINNKVKIHKFEIDLEISKKKYNYDWCENLNKKLLEEKKEEITITDNLPEIIKYKKNSILFANFFWHQILKINLRKKNIINKEIKLNRFPVICNYLFVHKKIINNFKIKRVGFFGKFRGKKKKIIKNILISIGTAKIETKTLKNINKEVDEIIDKFDNQKIIFFIDPLIFKKLNLKFRKNVLIANYSTDMYKKIDLAIIKPGLGTITSCLEYSIPMICYMKNFNKEFEYNSNIILKKKLGFKVSNLKKIFNIIKYKIDNNTYLNNYYLKCKKIKWNGESEVESIIKKFF